ncbi:MAG: MAPEG family protein [Xanthomonadales bacterium]|nr:MAPEG family protein [Xanthomonadales bacterium]
MTTELCYLTASAVLTALLWVPYILNVIAKNSISDAVGYGDLEMSPWAERLKKAHYNSIENLAPFAAVVLVANAIGLSSEATTMSAAVYFWARVVHPLAYTFAIPWVRTLAFFVAWAAILCIAWQIYAAT